jgi:hypothetical protein
MAMFSIWEYAGLMEALDELQYGNIRCENQGQTEYNANKRKRGRAFLGRCFIEMSLF